MCLGSVLNELSLFVLNLYKRVKRLVSMMVCYVNITYIKVIKQMLNTYKKANINSNINLIFDPQKSCLQGLL